MRKTFNLFFTLMALCVTTAIQAQNLNVMSDTELNTLIYKQNSGGNSINVEQMRTSLEQVNNLFISNGLKVSKEKKTEAIILK